MSTKKLQVKLLGSDNRYLIYPIIGELELYNENSLEEKPCYVFRAAGQGRAPVVVENARFETL